MEKGSSWSILLIEWDNFLVLKNYAIEGAVFYNVLYYQQLPVARIPSNFFMLTISLSNYQKCPVPLRPRRMGTRWQGQSWWSQLRAKGLSVYSAVAASVAGTPKVMVCHHKSCHFEWRMVIPLWYYWPSDHFGNYTFLLEKYVPWFVEVLLATLTVFKKLDTVALFCFIVSQDLLHRPTLTKT